MALHICVLFIAIAAIVCNGTYLADILPNTLSSNNPALNGRRFPRDAKSAQRDAFLDNLVTNLTVPELGMENGVHRAIILTKQSVLQLHLMFADNIVGPRSDNGLYGNSLPPLEREYCSQHQVKIMPCVLHLRPPSVLSTTGIQQTSRSTIPCKD